MNDRNFPTLSQALASYIRRLSQWMKPDPDDNLTLKIVKTILKSLALLVLILFSPVLLIGLALGFIGLM